LTISAANINYFLNVLTFSKDRNNSMVFLLPDS